LPAGIHTHQHKTNRRSFLRIPSLQIWGALGQTAITGWDAAVKLRSLSCKVGYSVKVASLLGGVHSDCQPWGVLVVADGGIYFAYYSVPISAL
jgi:hypothetical protein